MISRTGNQNFLLAHYEWIALCVGVLVFLGGAAVFALSMGNDPDEAAAEAVGRIRAMKPSETGVKPVDMTGFESALGLLRRPPALADVPEASASFLASERRVICRGTAEKPCGKAIPGDIKACPVCPFCGLAQEEEKKVVLDADGDGLPDEWERKFGLNTNDASDADADKDSDGFTNAEEYAAGTDPADKNDHPDYLDSLKIVLPLKETYMPFVFTRATQIPAGWRCEFFDVSQKDDYGRAGRRLTAVVSDKANAKREEIVSVEADHRKTPARSGFDLVKYEKKEKKVARKGMAGMFVSVDASEATVVRKRDGKEIVLVVAASKRQKPVPVDVQARLSYERGSVKNFDVVPGSEIELNGTKYRITAIDRVGKGAKVTVENSLSGKKRVLEALEQ